MPVTRGVLGCAGEYGVMVHWAGGGRQFIPGLDGVAAVEWERLLSDTSEATVQVGKSDASRECCQQLGRVEPWIHELSLYRDGELVWQGPIVEVTESRSTLTLTARDVTAWMSKRLQHDRINQTTDLATLLGQLFLDGFVKGGGSDPNVTEHMVIHPAGVTGHYDEDGGKRLVADQLGQVVKQGVDYTTIGRAILIRPVATMEDDPQVRLDQSYILADVESVRSGLDAATRVVARGQGVSATAGGVDPNWGLLETVTRATSGVKQQGQCQRVAAAHLAQSNPPPMVVRVPGAATLAPSAPVPMGRLVCGYRWDITLGEEFCRPIVGPQRLTSVKTTWEAGETETVNVSFTPVGVAGDSTVWGR